MTTIRPNPFPPNAFPQGQAGANGRQTGDPAKAAAARAFFAAAMGQSQATAAAAPAAEPAAPTARTEVTRTAAPSAEAPSRILRPGSIIDIRV